MSENPIADQGRIGIRLDKTEFTVAPSGNTTIAVFLRNQGLEDDTFALAIGGVPAAWVSSSQPTVTLAPGEEKESDITIQAPALGETETGERSLTIRAASKSQPDQHVQVKVKLTIQSEAVLSRVTLEMDSTEFAVAPGSSTTFTLKITNNGLTPETLRLYIDGIPTGWVSTPSPVTELDPGETKEVSVTISPPRASESTAGRHPLTIRMVSQESPDLAVTQEAVLTIGAFADFDSELQPDPPIEAVQNAQVNISNEGNTDETYQINWQSEDDVLIFELWQQEGEDVVFNEVQEHALKIDAGKQDTAHFRAGLRKRPLVGGSKNYPFQVLVGSSEENVQTHNSEIKDRGIIPIWVIPLVLVLCVALACIGVFIYNWLQDGSPPPSEDDSWARVQEAGYIRVATSADYPPFTYYNDDNKIDGFDIALIRDIGIVLGVTTEVSDYAFEGLGPALQVGQEDLAIAAISVTDEREAQFDFSNIYYVGLDGILAQADSDIGTITEPGQMAGMRVGVQRNTVYDSWARDVLVGGGIIPQDQLYYYAKPAHAVEDLRQGRLDVVIMDLQPATSALSLGGLELVGQGINQQRFAIALPQGSNALRAKINEGLLALQNNGRLNQLALAYLGLTPEDIIPPPTPEPTPEITDTPLPTATEDLTPEPCVDAMEFVKDLTYDDEDLTNPPLLDPAEEFQKGWQIKNTGTCVWDSTYYLDYVRGNNPDARMGGQPTAIKGTVESGQTYDMYVDLVAPEMSGEYVGYWQLHNTETRPFGQTIWVAIEVRNLNPETPTATVTPQASATPTEEPPPEPTATDLPPEPTETEVPPEPTATDIPPEPTATDIPPEPTATDEPGEDLRDKTWIMKGYLANIEDDQLTDPIPDLDVELIFNEGGTVEGNAGCNTYSGDYVTDGTMLTIENVLATKTTCGEPPGVMDQEANFLALLEEIEQYRINQDEELEVIREVDENNQTVEKIILLFYDLSVGPR